MPRPESLMTNGSVGLSLARRASSKKRPRVSGLKTTVNSSVSPGGIVAARSTTAKLSVPVPVMTTSPSVKSMAPVFLTVKRFVIDWPR